MRVRGAAMAFAVASAVLLGTPVSIDSARWWRSYRIAETLRLSPRQAASIEGIYQGSQAEANACARESVVARKQLEELLMSDGVDDAFAVTTSRVADIEAACRRTRTLMLYRIFRQLSPQQRQALVDLTDGHHMARR